MEECNDTSLLQVADHHCSKTQDRMNKCVNPAGRVHTHTHQAADGDSHRDTRTLREGHNVVHACSLRADGTLLLQTIVGASLAFLPGIVVNHNVAESIVAASLSMS